MNKVILMGRLTRDPEIKWTNTQNKQMAVARYTLAVERRNRRENQQSADFINCVAFGKSAEIAEKYFHKGTKLVVVGRIQTGSYTSKEGMKIYTTDVVIEEQEFAESKAAASNPSNQEKPENSSYENGFLNIPDEDEGEELPFH